MFQKISYRLCCLELKAGVLIAFLVLALIIIVFWFSPWLPIGFISYRHLEAMAVVGFFIMLIGLGMSVASSLVLAKRS